MEPRFSIATRDYQGPLDKLLDLIEERKLSISDISLSAVADAYLTYVESLDELPLGETAQFILVASTLLLIKSRSLLPTLELSNEERESVDELERRLARLKSIRTAARLLRLRWGSAPYYLPRRAPARPVIFAPAEASRQTMHAAAQKLLQILPKPEAMIEAAVRPVLALEDVIVSLKKRLSSALKARFSDLIRAKDRHETIVYFLAMLELVRAGTASVSQEKLFADITIELDNINTTPTYG